MSRTSVQHIFQLIVVLMLAIVQSTLLVHAQTRAVEFSLPNGMQAVVIPDHRAPVVTHMVWYRVGAADETPGVSGIAHFLEHLMFKSTDIIPSGEFSKIVSRLGGQDNAFTGHDATAYFQRVAKERLPDVMKMEADRMVNLRLTEKEVLTERDVILEERRSRIENNPSAIFDEQMSAAQYMNHHYGIPVIGWEHEIATLTREDALTFYKRYYAPNNAILVVAGDVTPDEVKRLALETYAKHPSNPNLGPRNRAQEPPQRAARHVEYRDARAGKPQVMRTYLAPAYATAKPGEAEALDILMKVVGGGSTSRLYRSLVMDKGLASSAGGYYGGSGLDSSKIAVYAVPSDGSSLDAVEAAIDEVLADIRANGVSDIELERAKKNYIAEYVYESDNQSTLARRYGWGLAVGRTVADIEAWPERISKVTRDAIAKAAVDYLDTSRSVTGRMLPDAPQTARASGAAPAAVPAKAPAAVAPKRS